MIEYIVNNAFGCLVYQEDEIVQMKKTNLSFIKELCLDNMFSYSGYLKAVKKKINISYKTPVYIDDLNRFIPTRRVRDYENIWVNCAAVKNVSRSEGGVRIRFFSDKEKTVNISFNSFIKQMKQLEVIRKVKVNTFIFN